MVNFDVISLWLPSRDGYVQIGETSRLPSLSAPRYPVPELGVTSIAGDGHTLDIHLRVNISNTEQTIGVIMEMENQFAFEYGMSLEEFLATYEKKCGRSFFETIGRFMKDALPKKSMFSISDLRQSCSQHVSKPCQVTFQSGTG